MTYYNYHAMAKKLLNSGNCFAASFYKNYHHISPALVLYFENHKPIPIREYMWKDYFEILKCLKISIQNPDNIDIKNY